MRKKYQIQSRLISVNQEGEITKRWKWHDYNGYDSLEALLNAWEDYKVFNKKENREYSCNVDRNNDYFQWRAVNIEEL